MNTRHFTALALAACSALAASGASAQDFATVISSMPILEQVQIPSEVCVNRQITVQQEKSGGGAVMGAIAGGAVGNAIGQGSGNALATAIGVIGGAVLGDRIEGSPGTTQQTVRDCHTEMRQEARVKAYRVVYEYAGKRYEIQTPNDPGKTIPINISPAVPLSRATPSSGTVIAAPSPAVVYPATRVWVRPPMSNAIGLSYNDSSYRRPGHPAHRKHKWRDDDGWSGHGEWRR